MRKTILCLLAILLAASGCATVRESYWKATSEVNIDYDQAWSIMVNTLSKQFDLETIDAKSGYLKTGWKVTNTCWGGLFSGGMVPCKRTRVIMIVESRHPFKIKIKAENSEGVALSNYIRWVPNGNDEKIEKEIMDELMRRMGKR